MPLVFRAPPCLLFDPGEDHGAARQVAGSEGYPADVVGEEGTVGTDPREFAVELGQALKGGVDIIFVVSVQQWRQPVQLVDRAGQRRAGPAGPAGPGGRVGPGRAASEGFPGRRDVTPPLMGRRRANKPLTGRPSRSIAPENSSPSLDSV